MERERRKYYSPRGHDNIPEVQRRVKMADEHLFNHPMDALRTFRKHINEARAHFENAVKDTGEASARAFLKGMRISDKAYYYNRATDLVGGAVDKAYNRLRLRFGDDLALKLIRSTELSEDGQIHVRRADTETVEAFHAIKHDYHELKRMLTVIKVAEKINTLANTYGKFVDSIAERVAKAHGVPQEEIEEWRARRALPFGVKKHLERKYMDTL